MRCSCHCMFILLLLSFSFLASGQVSEKDISGPICEAVEDYSWCYFKLPENMDEVANYVGWINEIFNPEIQIDYAEHRLVSTFIDEIRNNNQYYFNRGDSCVFFMPRGEIAEFHRIYSPLFLLKRLPYLPQNKRIYLREKMNRPQLYDNQNHPIFLSDDFNAQFEKAIKDVSSNCKYIVCRIDDSIATPYTTIFFMNREGCVFYSPLGIPCSSLQVWSRETMHAICNEDVIDVLTEGVPAYLSALADKINCVLKNYPEVNAIAFISSLFARE